MLEQHGSRAPDARHSQGLERLGETAQGQPGPGARGKAAGTAVESEGENGTQRGEEDQGVTVRGEEFPDGGRPKAGRSTKGIVGHAGRERGAVRFLHLPTLVRIPVARVIGCKYPQQRWAQPMADGDFDPVAVEFHEQATSAVREILFKDAQQVRQTL